MLKLTQVDPSNVWYEFEDETGIEYELNNNTIVITGNRDFKDIGDSDLIKVIKGDYYDDDEVFIEEPDGSCREETIGYEYDTYEELKKLTGKEWDQTTIKGYSQGDWQDVYFVKGEVSADRIEEIENFYMGKVSEFRDEDACYYYVPDDVVWKGKKAICEYLDLKPEDTIIFNEKDEEIE